MRPEFSITTDLAGQDKPIEPLFAAFEAASFSAVHWCQDWSGDPVFYSSDYAQEVRQRAERHGLRIADVHGFGGPGRGVAYPNELFAPVNINRAEFASQVGAEVVVLHLPIQGQAEQEEAIASSVALLQSVRPAFEKLGVRAAVENLVRKAHVDAFFAALLDEFDPGFLGFCYDSGHAVLTGQPHLLKRHIDRLLVTHLHDNDGSGDQHRLPGEGKVDWAEIFGILQSSAYCGTVNLELRLPDDTDLASFCRKAYSTLSGLWGGAVRSLQNG